MVVTIIIIIKTGLQLLPVGRQRRWRRRRRGVLPLIHLLGIGQLGSGPPATATETLLVGLHLGAKDGQLDLLVINLEDGCQYSTEASRIASGNLGTKLINLDAVGAHAPVHDILPTR